MSDNSYWKEAVEISLSEAGIDATPAQIIDIANDMDSWHENHGMATGRDAIPNPANAEIQKMRQQSAKELRDEELRHDAEIGRLQRELQSVRNQLSEANRKLSDANRQLWERS